MDDPRSKHPAWLVARAGLKLQTHPDPVMRRLGDQIHDWWWATRGAGSLDQALGLRKRGGVSTARAQSLAQRDRLLTDLYCATLSWQRLTPTAAAGLMVLSAKRYEEGRWLRERYDVAAPSAEPAATWWRCLQIGRIPKAKRLAQILAKEIQSGI